MLNYFEAVKFKEGRVTANLAQVITLVSSLSANLSNGSGTSANQRQGLRVFHNLLWKEIFFQPRKDSGSS
jgi:hypothetical protein